MDPNKLDYDKSDIHVNYNTARKLPLETTALWMNEISGIITTPVKSIIDLGCGTGRFTGELRQTFDCSVTGIDPSDNMLSVARQNINDPHIVFRKGSASSIPVSEKVSLVFMSMSLHYFIHDIKPVLAELKRVLEPGGYIVIRNSTKEDNSKMPLFDFFPTARKASVKRVPSEEEVIRKFTSVFQLVECRIVKQICSQNREDYLEKIGKRGISELKVISDAEFKNGLQSLMEYLDRNDAAPFLQEEIHLFVFRATKIYI